ncbi:MAG TPA: hypothetical protein VK687_02915 [Bryobacteraceae bacterium]|nr:hypothetical protein [Bryobacteraceae bacterium]
MKFRAASLFVLLGCAGLAQDGSRDPAFAKVPFDQWLAGSEQPRVRWNTRVLPVELSNFQRLRARVEIQVDGEEVAKRRGRGFLVMLVQFNDSESRVYQTHKALDLQEMKETAGKMNFIYSQDAFVLPGDYKISLGVFDTETGDHSVAQRMLHVGPLKNDPLPAAWRDLPPVELLHDAPDEGLLPSSTGRLNLPLETRRPVRVELLVNASGQAAKSNWGELIPALSVLSDMNVVNGALNVVLLDLARQKVVFEQNVARNLDWRKLEAGFKQADPKVIDVHSLEKRGRSAQFFVKQVGQRIADAAEAVRVLIVLTGPAAFDSGENLHAIELGAKPAGKLFYIRYHSPAPKPEFRPTFEEPRFGRRQIPPLQPRTPALTEPIDELERTMKPIDPRVFDVYTPDQFRKALGTVIEETSKL